MDNNDIFKYLKPSDNDILSKLKGKDILNIIELLDNDLDLRNNLGLDSTITFGLELEYENIHSYNDKEPLESIKEKLQKTYWVSKYDSTLNFGVEINSPVLRDNKENWLFLDDLIKFIKPFVSIGDKSGGHIHVGTPILGDNKDSWLNFLKLWSTYENIIYRFTNGEFITSRKSIAQYAMPTMKEFKNFYGILKNSSLDKIIKFLRNTRRYQSVNFWNVSENHINELLFKNTIEFRCPNSSLSSIVWQNNVNLFTKMLLYCKSKNFNDNVIDNRFIINNYKYDNLYLYDEIFLDQALEFVDLIFTNNLDKIYFLKQYFKSFDLKKEKTYKEPKILIKK